MFYIFTIIYAIILFLILILLKPLVGKINFLLSQRVLLKRTRLGIISMQDLYSFGYTSFKKISKFFLKDKGYTDIKPAKFFSLHDIDFVCNKRNVKTYVQCFLDDLIETEEFKYSPVGRPHVQRLLGRMVHDNVKKGVIFTNGYFSPEALEFVSRLRNEYEILLIDGFQFTKAIRDIKESGIFDGGFIYE